ncbi:MAG: SPOR domain-containing protein [Nitrospirae bacterium]|nr:SPOR domain-containing protein [Nitrospirota bacterium]
MDGDNILVIDDDKNNTQQISEILRKEGYTTHIAKTKAEALRTALEIHPVLVLVKSMLIDASGYEVIRDLRNEESLKNLPFIMLSEIEKKYDDRYRTIYKIVDTVRLPVEKDDLLQKIREHTEWGLPKEELPDEDIQNDDIRFDLAEKGDRFSDTPRHARHISLREESEFDESPLSDHTIKINSPESPPHTGDTLSDVEYTSDEDLQDLIGEDTTAMESDEDEILNTLKENRAKRKKFFAITAFSVFAILLAVVYLLFLRDTSPDRSDKMLAKAAVRKTAAPTPPPSPTLTPKPEPSPVKPTEAMTKPVEKPAAEPAPKTPLKAEPAVTPAAAAQTQKSEPVGSRPSGDVSPAQEKKQPVAAPITKPVERPVAEPSAKPVEKPVAAPITKPAEKPVAEPAPKATPKAEPAVAAHKAGPAHRVAHSNRVHSNRVAHNNKVRIAKKGNVLPARRKEATSASGAYVIQLGSFRELANAKKLTDSLSREGYGPSIITVKDPQGTATYKVLAGRYKNKADAMSAMKKLKDTRKMDVILRKP